MGDGSKHLEPNLDPVSDIEWEEARAVAHRWVDLLIDDHRALGEGPCWTPPPETVRASLERPVPPQGLGLQAAATLAEQAILPFSTGNRHPRFWGWVKGAGTVPGMLGAWMAAAMNANVFGGDQGPVHLERQVLEWFRTWFRFPEGSSGLLVDGGSMANLLGLAVARHHATEGLCKRTGPEACRGLRIYASAATHNSIQKGAEFLGLGSESLCLIEVDALGRVDVDAMAKAIQKDLDAGLRPFCIVGSACTVGTGAMDPLPELRQLANVFGLWLHVDGAIGALGWLSERLRPRLAGLDQADSLAFDLHKWGQIPYDAGCLLVRDGACHKGAFEVGAKYLGTLEGGLTPHGCHMFHAFSPLLSRGDRALKIWMTLMTLGLDRWVAVFEKNVDQAVFLAEQVDAHPSLQRLAPVGLNIVCFRYAGQGVEAGRLDALNERILVDLQASGFCVMSPFRLGDQFCLRVAISNHRTRRSDLEALVARVVEAGDRLSKA